MQIHQFQVSYVAEHDRIVVRMQSPEGEEHRLWLTRRMLRGLYPHLEQTAAQLADVHPTPAGPDGAAYAANDAFQRLEAVPHTAVDTTVQSPSAWGDGTEPPLLVTTAHLQLLGPDMLSVRLEETLPGAAASRQVDITMGHDTLQALLHVVGLAMRNSDWGIGPSSGTDASLRGVQPAAPDAPPSEWDLLANAEPPKYWN